MINNIVEMEKVIIKCPYIMDCDNRNRNLMKCFTAKHIKCDEYQDNVLKKKDCTKWWREDNSSKFTNI
ncbi:MAG: hypothetical protein ACFFAO_16795 [Candidatus Hermodarchaeota archaeon]